MTKLPSQKAIAEAYDKLATEDAQGRKTADMDAVIALARAQLEFTPLPKVKWFGPVLPAPAKDVKDVRYVLSSDNGTYDLLAYTDDGVFRLNEVDNLWERT